VPTARIFALLTLRPESAPPWPLRTHMLHLSLGRLSRPDVEMIVARVAGGKALPDAVLREVVVRTDGIPLFVEELTRTVLESGVLDEHGDRYELHGPLPSLAIPTTLHDSLLARLDRLGGAKEVAQWAAAIGREAPYELLQAVCPVDVDTLQRELQRLLGADLLYRRGTLPRATYVFRHALIQAAAYESLLRSHRQQYHRRIAETLAERFPEAAEADPAMLARHYTEAGLFERAIVHWQRAGQRAIEHSANAEAIGHLTTGLDQLRSLPADPERLHRELELLTMLGPVLMPTKGYGSPEVEAVYSRALEVCRQVGETSRTFSVVRGLWELYDVRGDLATAREMAAELLRLASHADDSGLLVIAHNALGETLTYRGDFALAHEHLERGIALYDRDRHRDLAYLHGGYDAGVMCRAWDALALWCLGDAERALARCAEALELAEVLSQPNTLPFALSIVGILHHVRRDAQATLETANAVIALSNDQGFTFWAAFATMLRGWALGEQGQVQEGLGQIRQGLAAWEATGARVERPLWLALLAEVCARAGLLDEGLALLAEGLAVAESHEIRFHDAELLRLRGVLLLAQPEPDVPQAAAAFRAAIDVAQRQGAGAYERRAARALHTTGMISSRPT
jgi:predicted ATPase